jgi:hypothetical protein
MTDQKDHPGPAGNKPTREEYQRRVEFAEYLLFRRLPIEQVKARLKGMFQVSYRTAERLLAAARRRLLARSGKTKQQHLQEALDFWESIVTGPDAQLGQRMDAQRELSKLLGLNAPLRHAHGGDPAAPPIPVEGAVEVREVVVTTREEARVYLEAMRQGRNGDGDHAR